jgi:predicted transcriptional regulator
LLHEAAFVEVRAEGDAFARRMGELLADFWRTSINGAGMTIVTLSIASREEVSRRAAAAFRGEEQGAHISFSSVDLLWNTLTRKRWEILRAMTGQGALSIP